MKIGILTFHFAKNYGAVLQAYALQNYLSSIGHMVEVIDYEPKPSFNDNCKIVLKSLLFSKPYIYFKLSFYNKWIQGRIFRKFKKNSLKLTKKYSLQDLATINEEFDAIIVGSDQVWNPSLHKEGVYFLKGLKNFSGRRISYAPCCAYNYLDNGNVEPLTKALSKFSKLSVRNLTTQEFILNLINKKAEIVLDPTLLWDFSGSIGKPIQSGDYIVTYILGSDIDVGNEKVVDKIRKVYPSAKVISTVLLEKHNVIPFWADNVLWKINPFEWLNLLFYAKFVYTDSFHGLLFSIKFKKHFLAYYSEKARSSRFIDMTLRFPEIAKFIVGSYNDIIINNSLDLQDNNLNSFYQTLSNSVEQSKKYLDDALK